jgi:cytochrome P450
MTPGLVAYKLSRRMRDNPYRWFRLAQRFDPVHESVLGVWILTSHSAVSTALRHPSIGRITSADPPVVRSAVLRRVFRQASPEARQASAVFQVLGNARIFTDPGEHPRLQASVSRAFTPRRISALRSDVQECVDEMLDDAAARGRFELIADVATKLPTRMICRVMGVPESDEPIIAEHAPWIMGALASSPLLSTERLEGGSRATAALVDYVSSLVSERRKTRGDDLISALLAADDDGRVPDHDQTVAIVLALLVVGQETVVSSIGQGVLALLRNPGELARWRDDPSIEQSAVEELLRYSSPTTLMVRHALDDLEIEGRSIRKGNIVAVVVGAANRDAHVFPEPDRLDLTRQPNPHVAFGGGAHYCIGAPLARMELASFFSSFVQRLPEARLAPGGVQRLPGVLLRGLQRVEILTR